jgi:hypothetical protein
MDILLLLSLTAPLLVRICTVSTLITSAAEQQPEQQKSVWDYISILFCKSYFTYKENPSNVLYRLRHTDRLRICSTAASCEITHYFLTSAWIK